MSRKIPQHLITNDLDYAFNNIRGAYTYRTIEEQFKTYCREVAAKSSPDTAKHVSIGHSTQQKFQFDRPATAKHTRGPLMSALKKGSRQISTAVGHHERFDSLGSASNFEFEEPPRFNRGHTISTAKVGSINIDDDVNHLIQEFGISVPTLTAMQTTEDKQKYIVECMMKGLTDDLKEFNRKHNVRMNHILQFEEQYLRSKEKLQKDGEDIFGWLNIKTPHEPLKQKLRSKIAERINDQENQDIIEKTLEDIRNSRDATGLTSNLPKIKLENVPVIDNHEILRTMLEGKADNKLVSTRKERIAQRKHSTDGAENSHSNMNFHGHGHPHAHMHSQSFNSQAGKPQTETMPTKIGTTATTEDEHQAHLINDWNPDKEETFKKYREETRGRLFDKIKSSNWNEMGFQPLVLDAVKEEKNRQQRDKKLASYMNGDLLTPDEYKLLANTSITLNRFVDKKYMQTVVNHLDPDVVQAMEMDIAEHTLKEHEQRQKEFKQSRLEFLRTENDKIIDRIEKRRHKSAKVMKAIEGKEEQIKVTHRVIKMLDKTEERKTWRKKIENTAKENTNKADKAAVQLFAHRFLKVIDAKLSAKKAKQSEEFLRRLLPITHKQPLIDVETSRHFYHPSSKLMVKPPTEPKDIDYLGLGVDYFNPGLPKRKNENPDPYKLAIHCPPQLKNKDNFKKFYSGGPEDDEDRVFHGNFILKNVSNYKVDYFKLKVIMKIQAAWRGYVARTACKRIQERARERQRANVRKVYLKNKVGNGFVKTVLLAQDKLNPKGKGLKALKSAVIPEKGNGLNTLTSLGKSPKNTGRTPKSMAIKVTSPMSFTSEAKRFFPNDNGNPSIQLTSPKAQRPSLDDLELVGVNANVATVRGVDGAEARANMFKLKRPTTAGPSSSARAHTADNSAMPTARQADDSLVGITDEDQRQAIMRMKKIIKRPAPKGLLLKQRKLFTAAKTNNYNMILMSNFTYYEHDVNIKDDKGNTPLYYAAKNGSREITEFLVRHKAYVNEPCTDGNTPLHMAFKSGNVMIVIMMISAGGNLNQLNFHGQTPIAFGSESLLTLLDLKEAIATHNMSNAASPAKAANLGFDNNQLLNRQIPKKGVDKDYLTFNYKPLKDERGIVDSQLKTVHTEAN